jgi:hypothetical protein
VLRRWGGRWTERVLRPPMVYTGAQQVFPSTLEG